MSHEWTLRFLEHRIADKRILRLIAKWLKVGVVTKEGHIERSTRGAPQGAVVSPTLANVYLRPFNPEPQQCLQAAAKNTSLGVL